jgi:hypothetical protein
MKGRLLAIAAVVAATIVLAAEHRQVGALREEVDRLREEIARNQQVRDSQPLVVPIRVQGPSQNSQPTMIWPERKRSPFRLIDSISPAVESGMKADELEMKRRQQQRFRLQQNPYAPEAMPAAPSWAESK